MPQFSSAVRFVHLMFCDSVSFSDFRDLLTVRVKTVALA